MMLRSTPQLLLASTLLCSATTSANECNLEFDGRLKIADQILTVDFDKNQSLSIDKAHSLSVNGEYIDLSVKEQQVVGQYYDNIQKAVIETVSIATDGVELAGTTINDVLGELIGVDNDTVISMSEKFAQLSQHMQTSFYADDGTIKLDTGAWEDGNFINSAWENDVEEIVEEVIAESIGKIMIAIGTNMLSGDADMSDFGERIDRVSQEIESRVNDQANAIETRAQSLCYILEDVDRAEQSMQDIPGLERLDMIQVSAR